MQTFESKPSKHFAANSVFGILNKLDIMNFEFFRMNPLNNVFQVLHKIFIFCQKLILNKSQVHANI